MRTSPRLVKLDKEHVIKSIYELGKVVIGEHVPGGFLSEQHSPKRKRKHRKQNRSPLKGTGEQGG